MSWLLLGNIFPQILENFDLNLLYNLHSISIVFIITGAVILIKFMNIFIKSANIKRSFKNGNNILIVILIVILVYINIFETEIIKINDYPFIVVKPILFSMISTLVIVGIILSTVAPQYFKSIDLLVSKKISKGKKEEFIYSSLIAIAIISLVGGVILRINLGINWSIIIFCDLILLFAAILCLMTSFTYGFGESMQGHLFLRAIFISHYSGKLIFSYNFTKHKEFKDEFVGPFLIAINSIVQEIRTKGTYIERLVLEDNSEIILSIGEYARGILITEEFNPTFKEKLDLLINTIESEVKKVIKDWSEYNTIVQKRIEELIKNIF